MRPLSTSELKLCLSALRARPLIVCAPTHPHQVLEGQSADAMESARGLPFSAGRSCSEGEPAAAVSSHRFVWRRAGLMPKAHGAALFERVQGFHVL